MAVIVNVQNIGLLLKHSRSGEATAVHTVVVVCSTRLQFLKLLGGSAATRYVSSPYDLGGDLIIGEAKFSKTIWDCKSNATPRLSMQLTAIPSNPD